MKLTKDSADLFFDLEQDILNAWNIKEDIETFLSRYMDGPVMSEDDVSNYIMALMNIAELRCSKAFDTFEKYCKVRLEERDSMIEAAAQIVETEGLEPAMSVPPEPLRARLARKIRMLKSREFNISRDDWDDFEKYLD